MLYRPALQQPHLAAAPLSTDVAPAFLQPLVGELEAAEVGAWAVHPEQTGSADTAHKACTQEDIK